MRASLYAIAGLFSYLLVAGCGDTVELRTTVRLTSEQVNDLFDSAQHYLDLEQPAKMLPFLEKAHGACRSNKDLLLRYNGLLLGVGWSSHNYEDVLTASYTSLYEVSIRGEVHTGQDSHMAIMAAHALKKSGDTSAALKMYEFLAASEFLAMRRGGQANLLTLYSKQGNHTRAIELAKILEPSEKMNPADISAHVNRDYYWGRSLVFLGRQQEGLTHLKRIAEYLSAPRSNMNPPELHVRISTVRSMLRDHFLDLLPRGFATEFRRHLANSVQLDSSILATQYNIRDDSKPPLIVRIPDSLFIQSSVLPAIIPAASVNDVTITSRAFDSQGIEWISTLVGLYVRVGQHLARVELPQHRGLVRPVRSVSIIHDTLYVRSYRDSLWRIAIASLIHNHQPLQPISQIYTLRNQDVRSSGPYILTQLPVNDSTMLYGTSRGLQLIYTEGPTRRIVDVPNRNGVVDTIIGLFSIGDSIVAMARTFGYSVIRRHLLAQGTFDFTPFDPLRRFNRIPMPEPVRGIVLKQMMGEHPASTTPIYDELHPTNIQRPYFIGSDLFTVMRSGTMLITSRTNASLWLIQWPDSIAMQLRSGFYPTVVNDSTVDIASGTVIVRVDLAKLVRQPIARSIVAIQTNGRRAAWVGWLDGTQQSMPCADSVSMVVGSSKQVADYLTSVNLATSWSSDTLEQPLAQRIRLDVPAVRSCSINVLAPGVLQQGSLTLVPILPALMYQDVWIALTMLASGLSAWLLVYVWQRNASHNQKMLLEQHSAIARDLHDTVGADLARLSALLNAHDSRESRSVATAALAANRKFRSLLWIWRSDSIRLADFVGELREYAFSCLSDANIACSSSGYLLSEDIIVDAVIAKNSLMIFNESISNIIRHASAQRVMFEVVVEERVATIKLTDDGIGFDYLSLDRKSGIENIASRARDNGFHAEVISMPSLGTTVLVSFGVYTS